MTKEVTTNPTYLSKKARQSALQEKINQIDKELEKIGVLDIKYRIITAITNPTSNQNTIVISGIPDLNLLIRLLAYFTNMQNCKKSIEKDHDLPADFILKNQNGINVCDIIHDLNLRMVLMLNASKIKILTESKAKLLPFLNEESRFINALKEIDSLLKNTD